MSYFIKEKEFARFKNRVPGSLPDRLYNILKERTYYNTREEKLVQSTDTQEWYHLVIKFWGKLYNCEVRTV